MKVPIISSSIILVFLSFWSFVLHIVHYCDAVYWTMSYPFILSYCKSLLQHNNLVPAEEICKHLVSVQTGQTELCVGGGL